jgi:hypothetical protein
MHNRIVQYRPTAEKGMFVFLSKYYNEDQIKENDIGRTCRRDG